MRRRTAMPNKVKFDPSGSISSFALDDDDNNSNQFSSIKDNLSLKFNESVLGMWNVPTHDSMTSAEDDDVSVEDEKDRQRMDYYFQEFVNLQYTEGDMQGLVADDHAFRSLQRMLKRKNCTTNLYLLQNMHFFIRHLKEKRERNEIKTKTRRSRNIES